MKKILHWLPRILSILFILFISLFALDAFHEPNWFISLVIHLIPSFILTLVTILAWKNARLGGYIFGAIGLIFIFISRFEGPIIFIPMLFIGLSYLIVEYLSKE